MFYRFFILADTGPCSQFHDPIYKSEVFSSNSLAEVYLRFAYFLLDYAHFQAPSEFLKPDRVYVVYGNDPKVCPYRSSNKRKLLFGFKNCGKPFSSLGCDFL